MLMWLYQAATVHVKALCLKRVCERKDLEEGTSRIWNNLWCSCSKYKPMASHAESIYWLDKYHICQSYFKDILSSVFEIFLSSDFLKSK